MKIQHLAHLTTDPFAGVDVVVPKHVEYQGHYADVRFINTREATVTLEMICEDKPDLVVFHECYRVEYLAIGKLLRKAKIPYIILPHGELSHKAQQKKWLKKKAANILLFGPFIHGAKAIQCLSEYEKESTSLGRKRIVSGNGMVIPDIQKKSFPNKTPGFLYIGRLDAYHKGLDILIQAAAKCAEVFRAKNVTIDIYGPDYKGRFAHVLELIDTAGVGDIVHLHTAVSGAQKQEILLNSDIFIQTSRLEGQPLGPMEALSYGIPCLLTRGTMLLEDIRAYNAGWACETDADAVSEAMLLAISERESWEIKGQNGRRLAEDRFDWEKVSKDAVQKYAEVLHD